MKAGTIELAYDSAAGRLLQALLDLRRFDGAAALDEIRNAMRTIEAGQNKARREERLLFNRVQPATPPSLGPVDF
jgi:hypothetical protein